MALTGPVRRKLSPDDDLFDDGNYCRAATCKIGVVSALSSGGGGRKGPTRGGDGEDIPLSTASVASLLVCGTNGCDASFNSVAQYENHYSTSHRHKCITCDRVMPTSFLLDIHICELHDAYFKVMAEKQPMYRCLVETCDKKFKDDTARRLHLQGKHAFPESFDFHNPSRGRTRAMVQARKRGRRRQPQQQQQQQQQQQEIGGRLGANGEGDHDGYHHQHDDYHHHDYDGQPSYNGEHLMEEEEGIGEVEGNGSSSGKNGSLPPLPPPPPPLPPPRCRYYVKGSCREGKNCRFRHDQVISARAASTLLTGTRGGGNRNGNCGTSGGGAGEMVDEVEIEHSMLSMTEKRHSSSSSNSTGKGKPKKITCRYFNTPAGCIRGEFCAYIHGTFDRPNDGDRIPNAKKAVTSYRCSEHDDVNDDDDDHNVGSAAGINDDGNDDVNGMEVDVHGTNGTDGDDDDSLAKCLEQKLAVMVPRKVRFGGSGHRHHYHSHHQRITGSGNGTK